MSHIAAAFLMAIVNIVWAIFSGDWHTAITAIYFQSISVFVCWLWGVGSCKTSRQSK